MAGNFDTINGKLSIPAGQSVRRKADDSGFEAYTPSSGVSVGSAISSGTSHRVLFQDGSGNLAQSSALTFDGTHLFTANGLNIGTADTDISSCGLLIKTARSYPLLIRNGAGTNLAYLDGSGNLTLAGGLTFTGSPVLSGISELRANYYEDGSNAKGYIATIASGINFDFQNRVAGNIPVVVNAHASQTANLFEVRGLSSKTSSFDKDANLVMGNVIKPASMADSSAPNNSIYYSTDANKLVFKDSGGTVNNLY